MQDLERLNAYAPLVKFLAQILGPHCEVVLHNLSDKEKSVIAIENGHLSGRQVGDAATDYLLKTIQSKAYEDKDFETNYVAKTKSKTFSSSSLFIKNRQGEVIGTLCINIDMEPYKMAADLLQGFIKADSKLNEEGGNKGQIVEEQLVGSVQDILGAMIENSISKIGVIPERMNPDEKISVVKDLFDRGAFQLKGATAEVSKALDVSEPTIYRYMNKAK